MSQNRRSAKVEKGKSAAKPEARKEPEQRLKLSPGVEKLLTLYFLAATLVGLGIGLSWTFRYPLTSDLANAGLFPMEVAKGNFEFVFPANNPYFFTDYIFHLIIQPLTGYSPTALVLTGYAMYVLIVIAGAAIALRLAGRLEALAAAALVANLPFTGLQYVLYPLYHNGTLLFILLCILIFYADRPPLKLSLGWRLGTITALQFLGVFSDTLMLPLFTAPLIVYSVYQLWKQRRPAEAGESGERTEGNPLFWIATTIPAFAIFAVKSRIGQLWPGGPILVSTSELGSLGSLLQHPGMYNLYALTLMAVAGGIIVALALLVVVVLVIFERKDRFLQVVFVIGALAMLVGFMSMTIAGDSARYLTPIAILAVIVAATGTLRRGVNYIPLILIVVIVLAFIGTNVATLSEPGPNYLELQKGLVKFLIEKNYTHAYADYWSANVYTYMSGGKVMIEPVYVQDNKLKFQTTNAAPRWASIWPDGSDTKPVLITTTGSELDAWAQKVNQDQPPESGYELDNGHIYVYNGTLPSWPTAK